MAAGGYRKLSNICLFRIKLALYQKKDPMEQAEHEILDDFYMDTRLFLSSTI
jgi:hypothetical protein